MTITTVSTSNTFNEFRTTFNDTANLVNSFTGGTGAIFANTITTANGITVSTLTSGRVPLVSTAGLIVDDSNLTYNTSTDVLTLGGSTDASSSTTGTLIVTGGVGVAKKLYVGTDLAVTSNTTLSGTTDASSSTTGAVIVTGGVGIAKKLYVGTDLAVTANTTLSGTTDASSSTTGAVIVTGGVGIAKKLYVGTDLNVTSNTTLSGTTDASSSTTGAVIVTGGVGVAKKLYVGTDLNVGGNTTLTGELRGPSTFTIDPAVVGDDTGTVVIRGNLQIDGLTTTINSTTLTVDDKNIVLASGAPNSAAANGAGITIEGSNANIIYLSTNDVININKNLEVQTITSGIWNGTTIAVANGGTGITSFGTGVATALGVNTGTAGAFVVVDGVLGTPSSGTVTNLTGTASININGTIGATTANTANVTTLTANSDSSFTSTGALLISKGTTGQRTAGTAGQLRFNTTTAEFEGYNGAAWASVGGSAISNDTSTANNLFPAFLGATTGTAASIFTSNSQYLFKPSTGELSVKAPRASNGIVINNATISSDYTIAAGDNGMSAGPITVDTGVTVTISSGSVWTVV